MPVAVFFLVVHTFYSVQHDTLTGAREPEISDNEISQVSHTSQEITCIIIVCDSHNTTDLASDILRQIRQFHVMVKSALLFSAKPLHFIAVVDSDKIYDKLAEVITKLPPDYTSKIRISKKEVWYPESMQGMKTMFRVCATQRLFLEKMLPDVDNAIYIDTDFIFLRPVDELYEEFLKFTTEAFAAMAPCIFHYGTTRNKVPYYGKYGLNAGLMLMNFTRIRAYTPGFMDSLLHILDKYQKDIVLADQDLLNIFFSYNPELLHDISCSWNYRPLLCYKGEKKCSDAEDYGISAIHGNAMVFMNDLDYKMRRTFEVFEKFEVGVEDIEDLYKRIQSELIRVDDENMRSQCRRIENFDQMILAPIGDYLDTYFG